jgi:hypothetical protein
MCYNTDTKREIKHKTKEKITMMTLEMIIAQLEMVADYVSYEVDTDDGETTVRVTVEDFGGFDAQWREIVLDVDWEAVHALETWLETHADSQDGDYYVSYFFGDIEVYMGYASFGI